MTVDGREGRVWWLLTGPAEVGPVCDHCACLLTVCHGCPFDLLRRVESNGYRW